MTQSAPEDHLRIDKWLWRARLFKTRTLAGKFAAGGGIRLRRATGSERILKASAMVRPGDILTYSIGERVRIVEIRALGTRRGPAPEAQSLYTDLSPPPTRKSAPTSRRDKGAGRPTKKDRRAVDALTPR